MNQTPEDGRRAAPGRARALMVTDAEGRVVEGWAVRRDLVVVLQARLTAPHTVLLDNQTVQAVAAHERTGADGTWTALVLPEGSLPLDGELLPSGIDPLAVLPGLRGRDPSGRPVPSVQGLEAEDPDAWHTDGSWWCNVFPRLPGC